MSLQVFFFFVSDNKNIVSLMCWPDTWHGCTSYSTVGNESLWEVLWRSWVLLEYKEEIIPHPLVFCPKGTFTLASSPWCHIRGWLLPLLTTTFLAQETLDYRWHLLRKDWHITHPEMEKLWDLIPKSRKYKPRKCSQVPPIECGIGR